MSNGHRWSKFWWQDWQNDQQLKLCSLAAQGLWMRLLCMMHDANGHLLLAGVQPNVRQIAKITSTSERQVERYLAELLQQGVARRNNEGVIYCQRMINDFNASEAGREAVGKRWNGDHPNSPPNGGATSKPNGEATPNPNTRSLEAEDREEPPLGPPQKRGGRSRREIPWRSGALEMIYNEGLANLEQSASNVTAIDDFITLANVPRRVAR